MRRGPTEPRMKTWVLTCRTTVKKEPRYDMEESRTVSAALESRARPEVLCWGAELCCSAPGDAWPCCYMPRRSARELDPSFFAALLFIHRREQFVLARGV